MASWGKAKLSPAALRLIEDANKELEEDILEGIQKKFLLATQKADVQGLSSGEYGLLNDWPEPAEDTMDVNSRQGVTEMETSMTTVDTQLIADKIVEHVVTGSENINLIIELVANLNNHDMTEVVLKSWSLLQQDIHKKSFIIGMSATRNSALCVSSNVLLPIFSSEDSCRNGLILFGEVLRWLDSSISKTLVLPMFLNENSPINVDTAFCKAFFATLSDLQRTDILAALSETFQGELLPWHLQSLSVILELPIDSSAAPFIVKLISGSIDKFTKDRLMGKILLSLISILTPSTPPQVFHDVSNLASHFEGPLRFRHKQALDKLQTQLRS